ncbi:MAG: hypothetical protein R2873_03375 [Caldilineaceae bacterium]
MISYACGALDLTRRRPRQDAPIPDHQRPAPFKQTAAALSK